MDIIEKIQSDFTAEIMALLLLEEQPTLSDILIERTGNNTRAKEKDVTNIKEFYGNFDLHKHTIIESPRQSIYEMLPEALFHPSTLGGIGRPDHETIAEIQLQREKEKQARKFFQPFEQEAAYLQIQALHKELAYDKKTSCNDLLYLFGQGWDIINKLPKRCALPFIYILSAMHQIRGNKEWTEKCFSFITGFPVAITENYTPPRVEHKKSMFILGQCTLGIDTCTTGALNDGLYEWKIKIGPISKKSIKNVIPGSGFENLMKYLIEYFTPAQLFTSWEIITTKEEQTILDPDDENSARLGYSFYL